MQLAEKLQYPEFRKTKGFPIGTELGDAIYDGLCGAGLPGDISIMIRRLTQRVENALMNESHRS